MSNSSQPGDQRPERDPAAPPPGVPDGTSPVPPWSPSYSPGHAPVPEPEYPPTTEFPAAEPVNYAPPGYAPDYGQGHPPEPYAPPPGPPPRKSKVPIIAAIVAISLLLCGGVVTASVLVFRNAANRAQEALDDVPTSAPDLPGLPTEVPGVPGLPTDIPDLPNLPPGLPTVGGDTVKVTYEVTGDGPAKIFYMTKLGETPKAVDNVSLPWRFSADVQTPALFSVSATRTGTSQGSISCRTLVDGKEVEKKTSGPGSIGVTAVCAHLALN